MVAEIFSTIGEAISGMATALASSITSITSVFYTPGSNGAPGEFTFLGTLLLVAIGVGLVYLAYRIIKGAVRGVAR